MLDPFGFLNDRHFPENGMNYQGPGNVPCHGLGEGNVVQEG
jgi:hypothetical protein